MSSAIIYRESILLRLFSSVSITEAPPKKNYWGSRLIYWLIIQPISRLPYFLLYGVADFFYLVLRYVFPYRKKVILANLARVFPEKSEEERKAISHLFYRHFADLVVESLKNFSASEDELKRRMVQHNPEIINQFADAGKPVILCGGHYGNWELWGVASPLTLRHNLIGVYKKLSNDFFDQKMRETRSRFGLNMIPTKKTGSYIKDHPHEINALVLAFDQSPSNPEKCIWVNFFGHDSAAYFGPEKYATELNRPVIYGHLRKKKRGYYEAHYEVLTEHPNELKKGELTQRLFERLEQDIRQAPEFWLWSHKRWKHQRNRES